MNRRGFLKGMAGILAASTAPWVVTKAGVLMPVKQIQLPTHPFDWRVYREEFIQALERNHALLRDINGAAAQGPPSIEVCHPPWQHFSLSDAGEVLSPQFRSHYTEGNQTRFERRIG